MKRLPPRKLGEVAELVFMAHAAALGFSVLRPNSPCRYDLALDTGRRLLRIQVKSTATRRHGRYSVSAYACDSRWRYSARDIDFLAAWIVPLDIWYIIPARALRRRARVYLYPTRRSGWTQPYRERWDLLAIRPGLLCKLQFEITDFSPVILSEARRAAPPDVAPSRRTPTRQTEPDDLRYVLRASRPPW